MNPGEIRDFQVSRAARTLEVEMQMRKKRISRAQAIRETDEKRIEELDILADIAAFKEQVDPEPVEHRRARAVREPDKAWRHRLEPDPHGEEAGRCDRSIDPQLHRSWRGPAEPSAARLPSSRR